MSKRLDIEKRFARNDDLDDLDVPWMAKMSGPVATEVETFTAARMFPDLRIITADTLRRWRQRDKGRTRAI